MSQWYEEAEKEVGLAVDDDDDDNDNDDGDEDEDEMDHVRMKTCRSNAISLWTSQHSTAPPLRYSSSFKTFQSFQILSKSKYSKEEHLKIFSPESAQADLSMNMLALPLLEDPLKRIRR